MINAKNTCLQAIAILFMGSVLAATQIDQTIFHPHEIMPIASNGRFFNDALEHRFSHPFHALQLSVIKDYVSKTLSFKKYRAENPELWIQHDKPVARSEKLSIQWLGHTTCLIQVDGLNILTDPIFYECAIGSGYPRALPVGIDPKELPHIDIVILSHNHRDHCDEKSLKFINETDHPLFLIPQGTKDWFIERGMDTITEHTWWQESKITGQNNSFSLTFVPAHHWSARGVFTTHKTLWGGWIIKSAQETIYFAGDTAFNEPKFKAISAYAGHIDCALLPIGPCGPAPLMRPSHMGPEEAVAAFKILNADMFIPIHWGTFDLGTDNFEDPINLLKATWQKNIVTTKAESLHILKCGQRLTSEHNN